MSFISQYWRMDCGKIVLNENGQYFFVCVSCICEFSSIELFKEHQKMAHDAKVLEFIDTVHCSRRKSTNNNFEFVTTESFQKHNDQKVECNGELIESVKIQQHSIDNPEFVTTNRQQTSAQVAEPTDNQQCLMASIGTLMYENSEFVRTNQYETTAQGAQVADLAYNQQRSTNEHQAHVAQMKESSDIQQRSMARSINENKEFVTTDLVEKHQKAQSDLNMVQSIPTPRISMGKYKCEVCSSRFRALIDLNSHATLHKLNSKKFESTNSLQSRTRKNRNNFGLQLDISQKSKLPYTYEVCPKKLNDRVELVGHRRQHVNILQIRCDFCDKICLSGYEKENHIKHQHLRETYKCKLCAYQCKVEQTLIKHYRERHQQ